MTTKPNKHYSDAEIQATLADAEEWMGNSVVAGPVETIDDLVAITRQLLSERDAARAENTELRAMR